MYTVKAIDYETTGFEAYKSDVIFAFIITDEELESKVYRFDNTSKRKNDVSKKIFHKFHQDSNIIKVAHNAKFEMGFTSQYYNGELPESKWHDTFIMSKLLRNLMKGHKLETLAERYFYKIIPEDIERWAFYDKEVKKHMTKQKRLLNNYPERFQTEILDPLALEGITPLVTDRPNYGLIPKSIMEPYQIADGERCMLLHKLFFPKILEDKALYNDYLNEIELLHTSQKMEQFGMMLHDRESSELVEWLQEELKAIEKQKNKLFGFDINLSSPDQLQKHLFGHINPKKHENIDAPWKEAKPKYTFNSFYFTPSGGPSTSKEALVFLKDVYPDAAVIDMLLKYRSYSKGCTMIEGYKALAGDNRIIHPSINTNQAKTGRQSVSNPSLQNVSKETSIKVIYGIPARKCFRPSPGFVYFLGDYAGIEMRLIIAASGEKVLIEKLNSNIDFDVHTYNGKAIYRNMYAKELRAGVKDLGFLVAYGGSLARFSQSAKVSVKEARNLLKNFQEICPGICGFTQDKIKEVGKVGYITTAFGRKLYVEQEKSYTASNYQIQGDAAGILKRAQNAINRYLKTVWDYRIRMLLTVHDEIILEYPRDLLHIKEQILHDISFLMTNMPEISVPLAAEWKMTTTNWAEAKEIEI